MDYCELWLEMEAGTRRFRVVLLAPEGMELPDGYETDSANRVVYGKRLCYSKWYDGIKGAKESIEESAKFYTDREIRFLLFSEIRKPIDEIED